MVVAADWPFFALQQLVQVTTLLWAYNAQAAPLAWRYTHVFLVCCQKFEFERMTATDAALDIAFHTLVFQVFSELSSMHHGFALVALQPSLVAMLVLMVVT